METKLLNENEGRRTFAAIMKKGDEVLASMKDFARRERIAAADHRHRRFERGHVALFRLGQEGLQENLG
jgi:molybdopterin/thiamine biosynthesis adenylyltransferase